MHALRGADARTGLSTQLVLGSIASICHVCVCVCAKRFGVGFLESK